MPRKGHASITITDDLYEQLNNLMEKENQELGYKKWRSLSHFVEEALVQHFGIIKAPKFKHYNVYEDHATIIDHSRGDKWIDIYFRNDRAFCEFCQEFDCEHIKFLLEKDDFQKLLKKKGVKITFNSEK